MYVLVVCVFNLFFSVYVISKLYLKSFLDKQQWITSAHNGILATIPSVALAITALPFALFLLSIGWAYRQIVHIILTLTMREKYLGLITGCNAAPSLGEGREPAAITLIFTLKTTKSSSEIGEEIRNELKAKIGLLKYSKLFAARNVFGGFLYLEKNHRGVDVFIFKEDLKDFLNNLCHIKMSTNFDLHIGCTPLQNGLPIVIRIHHSLADGLSLYNIITELFCKKNYLMDTYAGRLTNSLEINLKKGNYFTWFKDAEIRGVYPVANPGDIFLDEESDTILTYLFENGEKRVPSIKKIKKRFRGVSFNAVVLAAFSASLAEFYLKKCNRDEIPEAITTTLPVQTNFKRFEKVYNSTEEELFGNDYSFVFPKLCIVPAGKRGIPIKDYLFERLIMVQEELSKVYQSGETIVNQTLMNTILEVTPLSCVKPGFSMGSMTAAISPIPGGPSLEFFTGESVEDVLFFTLKQARMGVCFTVSTYANKLQLGLKANRSKFSGADELDGILQRVFEYVDVLDGKEVD